MKCMIASLSALLLAVGLSQEASSEDPVSKGAWSYENDEPVGVAFEYGTTLTSDDIGRLSRVKTLRRIEMGYAGVDSEYVTVEGDLLKLGQLKNLESLHLCKDGIHDEDLEFMAQLPKIRWVEFNADNGYDGAPVCTDRCADYLSSAKTLRVLRIHDGSFTDKFVEKLTQGCPRLEELMLGSPDLTDSSLRLLAERCKNLKTLSITSDHFTAEGVKQLARLKQLKQSRVDSPALRDSRDAARTID